MEFRLQGQDFSRGLSRQQASTKQTLLNVESAAQFTL